VNIEKEIYVACLHDRQNKCPTFIYSPEGGIGIEDVAHESPEKIFKIHIDMKAGLTDE